MRAHVWVWLVGGDRNAFIGLPIASGLVSLSRNMTLPYDYEEDGIVATHSNDVDGPESSDCLYKEEGFPVQLLSSLSDMREQGVLCDVILKVGEAQIAAHRNVLAAASPYFRVMFTSDFSESRMEAVPIFDVDPPSVKAVIDYCYTGLLNVSSENVQSLFQAASLFQMDKICHVCCKYMERQIHPLNCIGIQGFAEVHGFQELYRRATEEIMENFCAVVEGEEFLHLEFSKLQEVLASDDLNIDSEDSVLNAAMLWLNSDLANREKHKYEILSQIRIPLLSPEVLVEKLHSSALFRSDPRSSQLISDVMAYLLHPSENSVPRQLGMTRPRKGRRALYVIGGIQKRDGTRSNRVQRFQMENHVWENLASMSCPRSGVGVCMVGNYIYAIGGFNGMERVRSGEKYDPMTNTWSAITPMPTQRSSLSLVYFNGFIYALGGRNTSHLRVVERYSVGTNEWSCCPLMVEARCYPGTAAHHNHIFAIGGFQNSTVECYDLDIQTWSIVHKYSNLPVRNPDGAWLDNTLYVVGGPKDDSSSEVNLIMSFDEKSCQWNKVMPFCTSGTKSRVTSSKGQLYAFITNENGLWIESYDPHSKKTAMITMLPDLALYSGFVAS